MARRPPSSSINFAQWQDQLQSQFRNLDTKDPSSWPTLPRYALLLVVALAMLTLLWLVWLGGEQAVLQESQDKEIQLRADYQAKLGKAINLEVLKKQREQVLQHVTQIEKQLPSKAEMDALLSDINQAGIGRNLQFDSFKPGQVVLKEYYAELPIAIKVTGSYHDMGGFASDIARLSRIVTLNNLSIAPKGDSNNTLTLEATVKTFRYLDADEVIAQRNLAGPKK